VIAVSATALAILLAFWITTGEYIRSQVNDRVENATQVFNQLINTREKQLISSAEILTSDFGFKQAVATKDSATITSALANHGERINADLMLLTDVEGNFLASTMPGLLPGTHQQSTRLVQQTIAAGGGASFIEVDGSLYQMILLPVRAPIPIAFAAVGFRMDDRLAKELSQLSGLEVTFISERDGTETAMVSTLDDQVLNAALSAAADVEVSLRLPFIENSHFSSRKLYLAENAAETIGVVLSASLDEAYLAFDELRDNILLIALTLLLLTIIGSVVVSRNLTVPLSQLVDIVGDFARGNYRKQHAADAGTSELQALFNAFSLMGDKIQERELQITYQAQHDSLTGLMNRNTLQQRISSLIDSQHEFFLIGINIRGFKNINDTFGQEVGDTVLKNVADRLRQFSGNNQLNARLGADEFLLVVGRHIHPDAEQGCKQLLQLLCAQMCVGKIDLSLNFCLGIAEFPQHADTAEKLMRRTSIALDNARSEGAILRFYQKGADDAHLKRLKIVNDLKAALANNDGQLFMVYQPKMNLRSGMVDKMESLIRWIHPEDGFIPPDTFIELAEQSGLITILTDWVIEQVIRQTAMWVQSGYIIQSAINISAQDLEREELLTLVESFLQETGLPNHHLCFELTERDMMQDADKAVALMQGFKERGFDLSVDDYGIGQSSLSKLKQMPVSEIKIDKSFVLTLDQSDTDQIIVRSTIELGHNFHLKVIAEGVETQASQDILHAMGCDYIQGYHLARPLAAKAVASWLDEHAQRRALANNGAGLQENA
jgi:diguanylate cyclase (GGDEF)-like protein